MSAAELQQDRKPQICLFIFELSFSYFTMNISGSISSASVCCSKEAKEADCKGCSLIFGDETFIWK